jgi:hypothetical protein
MVDQHELRAAPGSQCRKFFELAGPDQMAGAEAPQRCKNLTHQFRARRAGQGAKFVMLFPIGGRTDPYMKKNSAFATPGPIKQSITPRDASRYSLPRNY